MPRHLVLDQNYLRFEGLINLIAAEPDAIFILPDVALMEMCKGGSWRHVMRSSLAEISKIPNKVKLSLCVGEALRKELAAFNSIEGLLLPGEFDSFKDSLLKDVAEGKSSPMGLDFIAASIESAQKDFRNGELNHEKNHEKYLQLNALIKKSLSAKLIKALRNRMISEDARLTIICEIAQKLFHDFLLTEGLSKERAFAFISQKPILYRFYILRVQQDIEWIREGGLESQPAARITNNLMDLDYVLIGSFFDAILSRDGRVVDADRDLRGCLSRAISSRLDHPLDLDRFLPSDK